MGGKFRTFCVSAFLIVMIMDQKRCKLTNKYMLSLVHGCHMVTHHVDIGSEVQFYYIFLF